MGRTALRRRVPSFLVVPFALAIAPAPAAAQGRAEQELTGSARTEHFEVRFREGSRAEASVDRVVAAVEGDLAAILKELGLAKFPHRIRLFLYDDVAELQRVTGVPAAGFSVPLASHVPHDVDQTRVHELVHVVAEKFAESGPEQRNLFVAEGLANAVLRFVSGVHVDAVAAFHKQRGDLPSLAEVHEAPDFYAWMRERPAVNAYDVAGSWIRWLLDAHGAAKVRKYVRGVPVKDAFGADLVGLEKKWHAHLDTVKVRPGALALLRERHPRGAAERNPGEAKLGPDVLGEAKDWRSAVPAELVAGDPGKWRDAKDGGGVLELNGKPSQGDWCIARVAKADLGEAIVRCRATVGEGCYGLQIQIGTHCQALVLRGQGAFVYGANGCSAHDGTAKLGGAPVEIVLRRVGTKASVWIDGVLVCEGTVAGDAAPLGVGCVGGPARFTEIAVRKL